MKTKTEIPSRGHVKELTDLARARAIHDNPILSPPSQEVMMKAAIEIAYVSGWDKEGEENISMGSEGTTRVTFYNARNMVLFFYLVHDHPTHSYFQAF